VEQAAETQWTLGSRGGWLLMALLTSTLNLVGGSPDGDGQAVPFINAVSDVSCIPAQPLDRQSFPAKPVWHRKARFV
jgi:hypothetical protein